MTGVPAMRVRTVATEKEGPLRAARLSKTPAIVANPTERKPTKWREASQVPNLKDWIHQNSLNLNTDSVCPRFAEKRR